MTYTLAKNYGNTNFVTGMRAFAALAVIMIHTGGAGFRELGEVGKNFANFGAAGVFVFFVISGFSVALSYEASSSYRSYLNKRLWRIAPLYYFWLGVSILLGTTSLYWQQQFSAPVDIYNIAMHLTFLSFLDFRIASTIIGVEWSIPIEVFWYLAVPLMMRLSGSTKQLAALIAISLIVHVISARATVLFPFLGENAPIAIQWSPVPYVFCYALGIAVYRARTYIRHSDAIGNWAFVISATLILAYMCAPRVFAKIFFDELVFTSLVTAVLLLFGSAKSGMFTLVFGNRVIQFLGIVSYGLYLAHMPLLDLLTRYDGFLMQNPTLKFLLVSLCATVVSAITYYAFEQRLVALGKNIARRLSSCALQSGIQS
ncbi:acyltransferase [Neorhizobium galegae]|uniref:acyltransferase family protein n=1 Tax=Neorhizobium galegae TaxID=399 RepID=UPI0006224B5F|nr:acyltransferase [Neorhizobium galegae]MCQ1569578.1 acyltransferase [Neorhizobium galegae]CDZ73569.1 Probable acyltransferase protein [Neorhizobium galegae bv. orientalis]